MAIGRDDLDVLIKLREMQLLRPRSAIIEIGAQQLAPSFLRGSQQIALLGTLFNIDGLPKLSVPSFEGSADADMHLESTAPLARDFWQWLGFEYASIDIDGSPDSLPLDLNYDAIPAGFAGRYHVVTNFGTTEHVANQLNAFKIIHDLTAHHGIMIHRVPAQGLFNHGLANYNFKFFWMLARSNGYEFVHADFTVSDAYKMPNNIADFLSQYNSIAAERARSCIAVDAGILVVMKKNFHTAYVPPIDVPTGATTDLEMLRRRYWTVFDPDAFARSEQNGRSATTDEPDAATAGRKQATEEQRPAE